MYVLGDQFRKSFGDFFDQLYNSDLGKSFESVEWSYGVVSELIAKHEIRGYSASEICRALLNPVIGEATLPESLRKQFSVELKKCWRQQNPSKTDVRDRFYLAKMRPASEVFDELSESVTQVAAPMGWKILERKLDADGRYGISLGTEIDDVQNREKIYLLHGKIWEYLDIDCSIEVNSSAGQVSICTSYLLLVPYWKVNYLLDASYSTKIIRIVRENFTLLAMLDKILSQ